MKTSMTNNQILEAAAEIIRKQYVRLEAFTSAEASKKYLHLKLGTKENEVFAILFLDSQNQLIEYREMFQGTVNQAYVYPREVVKACIETNAAVVIFAHNHPSGDTAPSRADKMITAKLKDILEVIEVTTLDHIIVGKDTFSFAENSLL